MKASQNTAKRNANQTNANQTNANQTSANQRNANQRNSCMNAGLSHSSGEYRVTGHCRRNVHNKRTRLLCVSRRLRLLILTFMISAVSLICLSGFTNAGSKQDNLPERHKYYTDVYVDRDSTLWSIASQYITDDYSSMKAYLKEVREINGISGDTIYYGSRIIVPYYSGDLY